MKKMSNIFIFIVVVIAALSLSACSSAPKDINASGTQKAYVVAEDWGPAIAKTVINLDCKINANSVSSESFKITEKKQGYVDFTTFEIGEVTADRVVTDAYVSDENGNKVDKASNYVTIEMYVSPNDGGAFIYSMKDGANNWNNPYNLDISLTEGSTLLSGKNTVIDLKVASTIDLAGDGKICPSEKGWGFDGKFTASDDTTFSYAEYTPPEDDTTNALVIWLHGGGECGTDPQISMLANKVTALSSDEFQTLYNGAYVLVPQAPPKTHWCTGSEGDMNGTVQMYGAADSIYVNSLFELIDSYIASNTDIDPAKIIIGGGSAGGYMTLAQLFEHPDYFAAAFTCSEAYYSQYITDEMIKSIKDVPIWFTNAANDSISPDLATNPIVTRLQAAGGKNIHHSYFDDVHDTSGRFLAKSDAPFTLVKDGDVPYQYNGHFSWIYFDNNECKADGLNEWEWLAEQVQ